MFRLKGFFAGSSNWVKFIIALLIPFFFLCLTSAFMAVLMKFTASESLSVGAELAVQFFSSISAKAKTIYMELLLLWHFYL